MQTLQNILSQEMVQKLGWTLVHFIWQGAVIALLCAIVLRLMRKVSSNLRYTVAFIALAIMVAVPMVTIRMIHISVPGVNPVLVKANNLQIIEPTKTIKVDLPQDTNIKPAAPVKQSLKDRFTKTIETLLPQIVICWLIGVVVLSIWYLGGWTQLQRLRRQMTTPVSKEIKTKLNQLSKILGINKTIDVVQSVLVNVPTVIGHFKPVVLLPASTLTGLSGEQIEAILAHELAHIKRCDYLVNILQTVVEILGFYHPAVWWVSNKIRQERENCCDDVAVQITGDEVNYAQALATMEEIRFGRPELAVAASGGNLLERIKRLLGKDISNNEKAGWLPSAIVILLIAGLLIPMMLTLSSCDTQRIIKSEMNAKINRIDIDTATKADVTEVFGEPEKYMWGDEKKKTVEVLDKNNLPDRYIMFYPNDFRVFIANDHIIEFRFEGQSDYVFDGGLTVGSSIKKAFKVLGRPRKVVDGRKNEFTENTYFKNIDGRKGFGYYAVPKKNIRIWIGDDKVQAIYLTRSNYFENKPSRKLKDSELPEGSIIDANGYIVDKLDYPFVRDFYVIGTWKSVDYVREIENFKPDKQAWIWGELFLKEMVFNKDGTLIAKNGNAPKGYREKWTKGLVLYNNDQKTASKYTIKEIAGSTYMFYEWKSGDYTIRHQKPSYYVLKKVEKNDYSSVTIKEGVGFDDVIVGDAKCTREFLVSKFGKPDGDTKDTKTNGWWLDYRSKYGIDFWLNSEGTLSEIRLNPGFTGSLESGISMNSTMQDVFRVYGKPIAEVNVVNAKRGADIQKLYITTSAEPQSSYIYYNQGTLLFWFKGDKINQFVTFPKMKEANSGSEPNEVKVYEVDKSVADFADNDFSTPESAYAAINKISGLNDNKKWAAVSIKKLSENFLKAQSNENAPDLEWIKTLENAQIIGVHIWKNKYATVIAKLPQEFSSKPIKAPVDVRYFELENGRWLNAGNDRFNTIEDARAKFAKTREYQKEEKEKTEEILMNPQPLEQMAQQLFEKLKTADYNTILSYYDNGNWKEDGWKKLDLDYMVHTAWPDFALWVCRTFKDNPIETIELGKVFIGIKKINEVNNPAIHYKLVLKDGGILEGDLNFVYWAHSKQWQAAEGIDWHLQKDPIKKPADSNTVDKSVISVESRILFVNEKFFKDIKDANFVVDVNHGSVLNDDQRNLLLEMVRGSSDVNMLTAPRVTVYDGEDAAIIVVKPIDYISDYNESSTEPLPKVGNVRTGVKMTVLPKVLEKTDLITLALDFEYTDVEFEKKLYKEKYEYQIPNVNKTQILSRVTVADGQTVLLGGQKIKAEGELDTALILVKAQKTNEILPPPDCNGMTR
ncbi:MAG: M48 family metalloprotease [Planctomycetaceae bacterium]|nr:M48 family metalloprotease [Planctomycetaceae bacterium]